jgi:hypothetical protein
MMKFLFVIVVSLVAFPFTFAQSPVDLTPAGAAEAMLKFVELNNKQLLQSDEARKLLIGDAAKWKDAWFGQILSKPNKIVAVEQNFSVARIQAIEKNSRIVDLYFYLKFDEGWKIRFLRAMAQTGFTEAINAALKSKSVLTADEKETLANTELVLASDKSLTEWFQKNRLALDKLSTLAALETKKKPVKPIPLPKVKNGKGVAGGADETDTSDAEKDEPRTIETVTQNTPKFPKTAAALKSLHLTALATKSGGNIEITIGGITDNSVGFVYSPSGTPPTIDGWRYIWVEMVAPGWYLYRTT